jgi:hypothetical protein
MAMPLHSLGRLAGNGLINVARLRNIDPCKVHQGDEFHLLRLATLRKLAEVAVTL